MLALRDAYAFRAPLTEALRGALGGGASEATTADLLFLERWEIHPLPGAAAALRVGQIRRANPELAAAIRAEVETVRRNHAGPRPS